MGLQWCLGWSSFSIEGGDRMARIENTKKELVRRGLDMIENLLGQVNNVFEEIDDFDSKYNHIGFQAAKVIQLKQELRLVAKNAYEEHFKWSKWVADKVQGIVEPDAYTDAEVDAIDPNIRTHEE